MRGRQTGRGGFSLIELMIVVALGTILLALAIPNISVGERVRVNNAASEVREALQTARLRAVAVNRPLEIRFNCPAANQYRIVEAGFGDANRCSTTAYPYPAPQDAAYRVPEQPRYDGPVQFINTRITVNAADPTLVLQFGPDGRVSKIVGGASQVIDSVAITLTSSSYTRTINVNSLGKVITQ